MTKQERHLLQKLFGKGGFRVQWNHGGNSLYVKVINTNKQAYEKGHKEFIMWAYDYETWIKNAMACGYWEVKKAEINGSPYILAVSVCPDMMIF